MTIAVPSPYADADLPTLAAAAARDALRGGHDGDDPILATLYLEAAQFMHGACSLLASHLEESRGLPTVLIQGHPPGQGWMARHAMACACGEAEARDLIRAGRGMEVPVLDAAGAGTVADRMGLYRDPGWEYQAILGADPACGSCWVWTPDPGRPPSRQEGTICRLPALAHALGLPFDLAGALAAILGEREEVPRAILESGLMESLGIDARPGIGI